MKGHFVVAISRPRKTPLDRNVVVAGTLLEDDKRKKCLCNYCYWRMDVELLCRINYGASLLLVGY